MRYRARPTRRSHLAVGLTAPLAAAAVALAVASPSTAAVTLDAGYGDGGRASFVFAGQSEADAAARMADGSVVLAGRVQLGLNAASVVARLRPDGRLDRRFGRDGRAVLASQDSALITPDATPRAVLDASGGRLLVLLEDTSFDGGVIVVRLLGDGRLDPGFGSGGAVSLAAFRHNGWAGEEGAGAALDGRGRLLVSALGAVARLLPDGRLDPSFGDGGVARAPRDARFGPTGDVAATPAGATVVLGATSSGGRTVGVVVRFDATGRFDRLFGDGGRSLLRFGREVQPRGIAVAPDGGVLVGAIVRRREPVGGRLAVARLLRDGRPDRGYGVDGWARAARGLPADPVGLVGGRHGTAIVVGVAGGPGPQLLVPADRRLPARALVAARFDRHGAPDERFGRAGVAVVAQAAGLYPAAAAVAAGPGLVLAGHGARGGFSGLGALRLQQRGRIDRSFARRGLALVQAGLTGFGQAAALVALPGGGGVLSAGGPHFIALDGAGRRAAFDPAPAFGVSRPSGAIELRAAPWGLLGGGAAIAHGRARVEILALTATGRRVAVFGRSGRAALVLPGRAALAGLVDVAVDRAGRSAALVSAGPSQPGPIPNEGLPCALSSPSPVGAPEATRPLAEPRMVLVRWRADGHLDRRLAHRGWVRLGTRGFAPARLLVEPDGATDVAGTAVVRGQRVFAVRRYHASGRPDEAFGEDGTAVGLGPVLTIGQLLRQPDGGLLVAGRASLDGRLPARATVMRFTPSGRLDRAFGDDGAAIDPAVPGPDDPPARLAALAGGRLVIARTVGASCHGQGPVELLVLTADGRPDTAAGDEGRVPTPLVAQPGGVVGLAATGDRGLLVAYTDESHGVPAPTVARLLLD